VALHDRISEKVFHSDKPGPKQLLPVVEEKVFANFLVKVSQARYEKTRKEVRSIAGRVATARVHYYVLLAIDKGVKNKPVISHGWFQRFMQWQPQLSYQKGDSTANFKTNCLNREVITDYFALLKDSSQKSNC